MRMAKLYVVLPVLAVVLMVSVLCAAAWWACRHRERWPHPAWLSCWRQSSPSSAVRVTSTELQPTRPEVHHIVFLGQWPGSFTDISNAVCTTPEPPCSERLILVRSTKPLFKWTVKPSVCQFTICRKPTSSRKPWQDGWRWHTFLSYSANLRASLTKISVA